MKKPTLLYLCDSFKYINENCLQHQLAKILEDNFLLCPLELKTILEGRRLKKNFCDYAISCLRLRTLYENIEPVKYFLNDTDIFVWEQDVWMNFMDNSPYKNSYQLIQNNLNVKSFLTTSKWWSNLVNENGLKSKFVRMGLLPEYCSSNILWEEKKYNIIFQGSLYPHRKLFFEKLKEKNIDITILPSTSYMEHLDILSKSKIFIRDEASAKWTIDGQTVKQNGLWIKDIEIAGRGCYSIRDYDEEYITQDIQDLPTIFTYKHPDEIPEIVSCINSLSNEEHNNNIRNSVETLQKRNDWMTAVKAIMEI